MVLGLQNESRTFFIIKKRKDFCLCPAGFKYVVNNRPDCVCIINPVGDRWWTDKTGTLTSIPEFKMNSDRNLTGLCSLSFCGWKEIIFKTWRLCQNQCTDLLYFLIRLCRNTYKWTILTFFFETIAKHFGKYALFPKGRREDCHRFDVSKLIM